MRTSEAQLDAGGFLEEALSDPDCGAGIGVSGAIAEFMRSDGRAEVRRQGRNLILTTRDGAMRVTLTPDVVPVAAELPSRRAGLWQQQLAYCLDQDRAAMGARRVLTELGPDAEAIEAPARGQLRFDLGLGIPQVDACIRTDDSKLIALLRRFEGCALLSGAGEVRGAIVDTSPTRVFCSRLGRIEVWSPIPERETPAGPHTHLLPALLGRPSPIAEFIPRGLYSCLDLFPANPLRRIGAEARSFDGTRHARFQRAVENWGPPEYVAEKRRLAAWVRQGLKPEACPPAEERLASLARRVALRQLRGEAIDPDTLAAWRRALDPA